MENLIKQLKAAVLEEEIVKLKTYVADCANEVAATSKENRLLNSES